MIDREELILAVSEYGKEIQENRWMAGELVIQRYEHRIPDFRSWAYALGIMLRAEELLAGLA